MAKDLTLKRTKEESVEKTKEKREAKERTNQRIRTKKKKTIKEMNVLNFDWKHVTMSLWPFTSQAFFFFSSACVSAISLLFSTARLEGRKEGRKVGTEESTKR